MTNGDMQKTIEWIVEHQAQFAADLEVMREVHQADTKLLKEQYRNLNDAVTTVVGLVGRLAAAQEHTDTRVAEIAKAQAESAAAHARTDASLAEVAERLNIFINVVERYISENGGKGSNERA
jgi:ABC-type transporter Mla subunit MlaD